MEKFKYISQINAFYDWLETNKLSDSSIVLWHALMHINNKCGWKQEFAVAISTIENKTSLSKSSIIRSRNALQQVGRIKFTSREGQKSALYTIVPFLTDTQGGTQSGSQTATQSGTQGDTQTDTDPRLEEKRLDVERQLRFLRSDLPPETIHQEALAILNKYPSVKPGGFTPVVNAWAPRIPKRKDKEVVI